MSSQKSFSFVKEKPCFICRQTNHIAKDCFYNPMNLINKVKGFRNNQRKNVSNFFKRYQETRSPPSHRSSGFVKPFGKYAKGKQWWKFSNFCGSNVQKPTTGSQKPTTGF